ncbi:hypothetical protein HQ563_02410 [bacterium]|nr:hypothetical protein [bacterium]
MKCVLWLLRTTVLVFAVALSCTAPPIEAISKKGGSTITMTIVSKASELSKTGPSLVLGGFHMAGFSDRRINTVISSFKTLGVGKAAPCHCSGDRTRELFSQAFGSQFIKAEVGSVIKLQPAR